jgi:hypothetical protein
MAKDSGQNFSNHAQFTPIYHYFTAPLAVFFWIWAAKRAATLRDVQSHFDLLGATVMFGLVAVVRVSPLRVQDRVIRLEEQLRLARVLPADLQSRVGELSPRHLVALRFASDEEVTELVRKVLANPAITQKEIKTQIKHWRADYFRA